MSAANYMLCDNCGRKTIYIGEDEHPGFPIFCDEKCVTEFAAKRAGGTRAMDDSAAPEPELPQSVWALRDIANHVGPNEHMELHLAADEIIALRSRVSTLESELREARADSERIDRVQRDRIRLIPTWDVIRGGFFTVDWGGTVRNARTVREAIDALPGATPQEEAK